MLAVVLALAAGVLFGAYTVLLRSSSRDGSVPMAAAVYGTLVSFALIATAALATGGFGDAEPRALAFYTLVGMLVPGLSQYAFVGAIRHAGPARAAVLIGLAPLFSAGIAIVVRDEPLRPALALGTLLVVGGCISLAWDPSRPPDFRVLGVGLGVLCAVLFGVRDNLVRAISTDLHAAPLAATAASVGGGALALVVVQGVRERGALVTEMRGLARRYIVAAVTLALAYVSLVGALAIGRVTVVAPLNASQALFGVLISARLLGRADAVGPRLVLAAVLIVAGGALVAAAAG
jgi:drug/metabolite transporter (DMT)-like permease